MAIESLSDGDVKNILQALPGFLKIPARRFWVDYDEDADVLYLSFRRPQRATESDLRDDGVIVRTRRGEVVGLTILGVSARTRAR